MNYVIDLPMENDPIPIRLRALRKRAGLSMADMIKALGLKTTSGYQHYEKPAGGFSKSALPLDFTRKIAAVLIGKGTPPVTEDEVWALAGLDHAPAAHAVEGTGRLTLTPAADMAHTPAVPAPVVPTPVVPTPADMPRDLPVYGTAAGSVSGAMQADMTQAVDLVKRPPALAGAREAYALYVVGDSMAPRFTDGELVIVHPRRPVHPGDDVIIQMKNHDAAPVEVMIKRLVRRTEKALHVRQLKDGAHIEIKMSVVKAVHKVLTVGDLLGI